MSTRWDQTKSFQTFIMCVCAQIFISWLRAEPFLGCSEELFTRITERPHFLPKLSNCLNQWTLIHTAMNAAYVKTYIVQNFEWKLMMIMSCEILNHTALSLSLAVLGMQSISLTNLIQIFHAIACITKFVGLSPSVSFYLVPWKASLQHQLIKLGREAEKFNSSKGYVLKLRKTNILNELEKRVRVWKIAGKADRGIESTWKHSEVLSTSIILPQWTFHLRFMLMRQS